MSSVLSIPKKRWLLFAVVAAAILRLMTLGLYPLFDTTESRYAEIARKMYETGNWVTPQYHYGVPFWAKPPLSIWATAASYAVFGVNEFAARLSPFIFAGLIGLITYALARRKRGGDYALASATVLSTTLLFFVAGGGVMTDPAMAVGTTLSMAAFWQALEPDTGRVWGYLFFVGLGVGLLAKGPVSVVLVVFPAFSWAVWHRRLGEVMRKLPWLTGTLLMLAIALPWYIMAERRTPGFLNYFIVGEHLHRFVNSGWKGDLYGSAHSRPRGMIWLYWLAATLPWCIPFIAALARKALPLRKILKDGWLSYLLIWAVTPMLFFTLAGNILWTYVLPGLPAFALLVVEFAQTSGETNRSAFMRPAMGLAVPVLFTATVLAGLAANPARLMDVSQKQLVERYMGARPDTSSRLVYLCRMPYSAEFYTGGKSIEEKDADAAEAMLNEGKPVFFVTEGKGFAKLPPSFKGRLTEVGRFGKYQLFEGNSDRAGALPGRPRL